MIMVSTERDTERETVWVCMCVCVYVFFVFRDIKTSSMPLLKYPRKDCVIDFTYETITADEKPFSVTTVCVRAREREREREQWKERDL